jgi:hypothetical protein
MTRTPWFKQSAEWFIQCALDVDSALHLHPSATDKELVHYLKSIPGADPQESRAIIGHVRAYRRGNLGARAQARHRRALGKSGRHQV